MSAFSEFIARGGEGRLTYGLVIEGIPEAFVSDPVRAHNGRLPWVPAAGHTAYEGLDVEGLAVRESASWRDGELDAEGVTVRVRNDYRDTAVAVFGGRKPTLRCYLADALSDSGTTITVMTNANVGWPTSGILHIGREAIRYTGTTPASGTFTGCTRAVCSSLAVTHAYDANVPNKIQVTDVPLRVEKRRAQLYVFVDDDTTGHVIWRGVVQQIEQTRGEACAFDVGMDHVSCLLDQEIGATLKPFEIAGYYFPDERPLAFTLWEWSTFARNRACSVHLTGFFPTIDELVAEIDERVQEGSSYWDSAPTNDQYHATFDGGQVVISFRSDGATPRLVEIQDGIGGWGFPPTPGMPHAGARLVDEDGTAVTAVGVTASNTYRLVPTNGPLPSACAFFTGRAYDSVPEDSGSLPYTPDRVYHAQLSNLSVGTHISFEYDGRSHNARVAAVGSTTGSNYLQLGNPGGATAWVLPPAVYAYPDAPVTITPILNFGVLRWDDWLRSLADATPTTGTKGTTPWLPSAEFNWTAIEAVCLGAGGARFAKRWVIRKAGKLRDMIAEELKVLGLCWGTDVNGLLTVALLQIASPATSTARLASSDPVYDETVATPAQPITRMSPEGTINDVVIRSGWDAAKEAYTRLDQGAQVPSAWEMDGRKRMVIEPQGEDPRAMSTSAIVYSDAARVLCHSYAFPYGFVEFPACPGYALAGTLIGDIIDVTDARVVFEGVLGVEHVRGQVVARTVDWSGGNVSLTVRLSSWPATAYAPGARTLVSAAALDGTGRILTMRSENIYSVAPADGTQRYDFQYFQVGDVVQIEQIDTSGSYASETNLTITRVDSSGKKLHFDQAISSDVNNTAKRFWVLYDDFDRATGSRSLRSERTGPEQHDYAFIADSAATLGVHSVPAKQWGP